jgi:hypothetical protein
MNPDDRLDHLIRRALESQADQVAATQPSVRTAMHRLAETIGPSTTRVRPHIVFAPRERGPVSLFAIVLLLTALLATAVVVGALLLQRISPDLGTGPFGFAGACEIQPVTGVTLEIGTDVDAEGHPSVVTRLYADGALVRDLSVPGETKSSNVRGALYTERRLTPRGVALVLDRMADDGLTAGCRNLRTGGPSGALTASTPDGLVQVNWGEDAGRNSLARILTPEEEADLTVLVAALEHPETWLPEDAWVDPAERRITPDVWLVTTVSRPTDIIPGSGLVLPNGISLDGADPRYERVVLPGDAELVTFGDELPFRDLVAPRSSHRCAVVDRREALLLAESLDALQLGADGWGDVFTEDLSMAISIGIRPAYPDGEDCQVVIDEIRSMDGPFPTFAPPEPDGDLADVDPCNLVPDDADVLGRIGVENQVVEPSRLPIGVNARSCGLFDTDGNMSETIGRHGYRRATLTLYPRSVDLDVADDLALSVLGPGTAAISVGGRSAWENDCLALDMDCVRGIAAWSKPYLMVIVFDSTRVTQGEERALLEAVLEDLDG